MIDTKHNTFTLSLTKVIVVVVGGLFAIYVVAPVAAHIVAQVYVYGFIPDLISPIVDWFK